MCSGLCKRVNGGVSVASAGVLQAGRRCFDRRVPVCHSPSRLRAEREQSAGKPLGICESRSAPQTGAQYFLNSLTDATNSVYDS